MSVQRSNQEWLQDLHASGESQSSAIEELRSALLRAALVTFQRQLGGLSHFNQEEIRQLAEDCAQDALISVLDHLADFRGESKFLTWAYKFAVNISLTTARREQWKGISLDGLDEFAVHGHFSPPEDPAGPEPELALLRGEVWDVLQDTIQAELTEKQRLVLKWMVFDEVPMDVVVEHLQTNRNAVYKLLHDARVKLKRSLLVRGMGTAESIGLFGMKR